MGLLYCTGVICPYGSFPKIKQGAGSHRVVDERGKEGGARHFLFPSFCLCVEGWRRERVWSKRKGGCDCMFHDETISLKGFLSLSCVGIQICGLSSVRCVLWLHDLGEAGE